MGSNNILSWACAILTTVLGACSVEEVSRIVLLIVGIVSGIVSLAFNIYCWYKKAKEDGKITMDELAEGKEIVDKGIDNIRKYTEDKK